MTKYHFFFIEGRSEIDPKEVFITDQDERKLARKNTIKKASFPEDLVPILIKVWNIIENLLSNAIMELVLTFVNVQELLNRPVGLPKFVDEFKTKFSQVKKSAIEQKIRELAVKEKRGKDTRPLWYLKGETKDITMEESSKDGEVKENQQDSNAGQEAPVTSL
jgi:hypothetical protein